MMVLKYICAMFFPLLAIIFHNEDVKYVIVALAEITAIAMITNWLCGIKKWLGNLFNIVAILLMNVQFGILYWSRSFISLVMLVNLDSLEALSGKYISYGATALIVLIFSVIPVHHIKLEKKKRKWLMLGCLGLYIVVFATGSIYYSPYYSFYSVIQQQIQRSKADDMILGDNAIENEFYKDEIKDHIEKPKELSKEPNVILIFVEGLSQNIIEDERELMPNLKKIQSETVQFKNYYNHTFATYMGLSGQLYSGYQQNNYDINYLTSLQDIFKKYGYQTSFINTEPMNPEFSAYLENMNFDEVITDKERLDGMANTMSDKSAYELLFETALVKNKEAAPFFLSMYSFGTHASLDGIHEKYGDGSDPLKNKFYDLDIQLGEFFGKFQESELAENTVVILTADHATYQDADFSKTFPSYKRASTMLDCIPLMIYHKGVSPQIYDVQGRNSLDMTPTILDYLDMTGENSFLGESLFSSVENESVFDTYFESLGMYWDTAGGKIKFLTKEEQQKFEERIIKYFAIKVNDETLVSNYENEIHAYAQVNEEGTHFKIELVNANEWEQLAYAVWSDENGQDDLKWYSVEGNKEESFVYYVDLSEFTTKGYYMIHVYGVKGEEFTLLDMTNAMLVD